MIVNVDTVLRKLLLGLLMMVGSIKSSLVSAGFGMERRLLGTAVTPIALVSVTTLSS